MGKKVGIIIPSYNQGRFLEKAILSVLENSKNVDMQIAVMDGGSSDESLSIIKKYENQLTFWCSEPDKGQADAINKGIKILKDCDYYMWLNSDDVYEDAFAVQKIISFAEKKGYQVCYGLSHFINENEDRIGEYPVESFSYVNLGKRCYISQPSVMFSKEAYLDVGPIDNNMRMCLDYEYWMRLATKYSFGFIKEYIGCTRMYEDTKTSTMQKRHIKEAMQILEKYYGRVPMRWIVTGYLELYPESIARHIPGHILMILLYTRKEGIIQKYRDL